MRAFIGIEFSEDIKKSILSIQSIIKMNSIKGRWKYIDNFHLTLKFLGEVSNEQIDSIYNNINSAVSSFNSFNLTTKGLGFFKGNGCLRVIYLKLSDENRNLDEIFSLVEEYCYKSGIEKEKRPYTPHITIAQDVLLNKEFKLIEDRVACINLLNFPVDSINIIKSEQIENKRVYTTVYKIKLKG